jgi:hypothetical protein
LWMIRFRERERERERTHTTHKREAVMRRCWT